MDGDKNVLLCFHPISGARFLSQPSCVLIVTCRVATPHLRCGDYTGSSALTSQTQTPEHQSRQGICWHSSHVLVPPFLVNMRSSCRRQECCIRQQPETNDDTKIYWNDVGLFIAFINLGREVTLAFWLSRVFESVISQD